MSAWYVCNGGKTWKLCRVVSNVLGRVTVHLYDDTEMTGTLRREKYGTFVDAK